MSRMKSANDIRFYLYRSRLKVDMLYEQMFRKSSPKKLTLKPPLVSLEVEFDAVDADDDDKARLVQQELEARGLVGSIDKPREYFKGTMEMKWGLYDDLGTRATTDAPLVFFGGFAPEPSTVLGLGGSSCHVLGYQGASGTHSRSNTAALYNWMLSGVEKGARPERPGWFDTEADEYNALSATAMAVYYLEGPKQSLEFLAKTLIDRPLHGYEHFTGAAETRVLLGTPIWVAQSHLLDDDRKAPLSRSW